MAEPILYIDRVTKKKSIEKVYGTRTLSFLYGEDFISKIFGASLLHLLVRYPIFSSLYGFWQKLPFTKKKIVPFIKNFEVDPSEFLLKPEEYRSFNDFFIRHLKPEARPIAEGENRAVIPADGRYYFYQNINEATGFIVKNQKFNLETLLEDKNLSSRYENGSMVMARLCPTDYHRYHFPFSCIPGETRFINGWLYSVNPIAIEKDIDIFTQNKRAVCELDSNVFGKVLYLEIGATNVGSICQTYTPGKPYKKGDELGYFSFGASALILLFEQGKINFDTDLLEATAQGMEIRCLMGQSMGLAN